MLKFRQAALPLCALAAASAGAANAFPAPAARVSAVEPAATVDFEVFLPLRDKAGLRSLLTAQQTPGSASYHRWLTPAQFAARFGPTPASMAKVGATLTAGGLRVSDTHSRSLHIVGTAGQVGKVFGASLNRVALTDGHSRMVTARPIAMPTALREEKVVIAAFTGIPEKRTHLRLVSGAIPDNRYSDHGAYYYNDMKQAYNYPSYQTILPNKKRLDGTGVSVAVLMSGDILDTDLAAYFTHEHFTTTTGLATPVIKRAPVDGGPPAFPGGNSAEASLDVQQVLGGAPGSAVTLVGIPDLSDAHILDGYVAIVDGNKWDLVNSSFGGCELGYTPAYNAGVDQTGVLVVYDEVFQQGNAQGITFVASSGDSGALACPNLNYFFGQPGARFVASIENPADSPNVTAVGGGNLFTTVPPKTQPTPPILTSKYTGENAQGDPEIPYDIYGFGQGVAGGYWGAGGGRSVVFAQPTYQNFVAFFGNGGSGRIVPDVGMQVGGCPGISEPDCPVSKSSFVITNYNGGRIGLIGTSVASPEFVGAVALYVELTGGRVGNLNTYLWSHGYVQDDLGGAKASSIAQFYHKGQTGNDGVYSYRSTVGFDYMYGNGSPNVRTLFGMTAFAPAGNPQTASNP